MRERGKVVAFVVAFLATGFGACAQAQPPAQTALTWEQVRQRFVQANPTLLAGQLNVDESKAEEITAFL